MKEIMELREILCEELAQFANGKLSMEKLTTIDTLAHAIKNIDRILENGEQSFGSSRRSYRGSYGFSNDGSYEGESGRSYRRNSMGRYSRTGEFQEQLEKLMHDAPDDKMRKSIRQLISQIEQDGGQA